MVHLYFTQIRKIKKKKNGKDININIKKGKKTEKYLSSDFFIYK